jgi:transcription-repair coupling factor (superfamily II helicase)
LVGEGYGLVDFVGSPGEYSIRGGIIDVYPFSSVCPYRINFLDAVPVVFRVDAEAQLSIEKIENFKLSSVSDGMLRSLSGVSLDKFLPIKFNGFDSICVGFAEYCTHKISLDVLTHRQYLDQNRSLFNSITVLDDLSSVGVVDEKKNLFLPGWFTKKGGVSIGGGGAGKVPLSLKMSEIKRGDFLVHRDHGVGVCLGLAIKGGGVNTQEFLSIKYGDGGVLSIDVGRLDLVGYFAPSDTRGVKLDSLSKRGVWNRKKLSAKRRAEETVQHLLRLYVKRGS